MRGGLTERATQCLEFITWYAKTRDGIIPSYREIAHGIGLKSTNGVHRLIDQLEDRGYVRRRNAEGEPNQARSLMIIPQSDHCPHCHREVHFDKYGRIKA